MVPAVAAATAIIFFVLTAGQPTATAAIVEHTFIVSMTKFPCLLINLCKATEEYVCKLYMLGYVYVYVNVGEPGEYDALVQGDAGDRGERAAPGAGD